MEKGDAGFAVYFIWYLAEKTKDMHIQYYGLSCVKLTTKSRGRGAEDVVIVVNPFTRSRDLTPPQLASADIIVAASQAPLYYSDVAQSAEAIFVTTPGEYAIKGVRMIGFGMSQATVPATSYIIESENLKVVVITATNVMPTAKQFEEMNGAHIVIIAAGGGDVLTGDVAASITRKIEPAYVIPVHYKLPKNDTTKELDALDEFCEKIGACPKDSVQKIVIKDKDCVDKPTEVVLMAP